MKTKLLIGHWLGCIALALFYFYPIGGEALASTVFLKDIDSGLPSPAGNYRWLDVANQAYSAAYRDSYNYTQASVEVTYEMTGNILYGTLVATNLKPNFAYQLKLEGIPGTETNERIGLAGRWWQEEWNGSAWVNGQNLNNKGDGSSPNPNDLEYFSKRHIEDITSPTGLHYRYTGYLVFDYFITDEDGNATLSFLTDSSYHVLWATSDSDVEDGDFTGHRSQTSNDGPLRERTFDVDHLPSSIYEDGEDGTIAGWSIYANTPEGAEITNLFDQDRQSRVIQFTGSGTSNGYQLRNDDGSKWHNSIQLVAEWSMRFSENFVVYIDVETTAGHRYIYYTPEDYDGLGDGEYVHHGLGSNVIAGQWRTLVRDLQADLEDAQPGEEVLEVNGFLIRGSGRVDDIKLTN